MLIEHFPDRSQNGFKINRPTACPFDRASVKLWPNMLAHSYLRPRRPSYTEYVSPLAINCIFDGQAQFEVDGKQLSLDKDSYLIVNCSQNVRGYISPDAGTEVFSIFFQADFVADSFAALITPDDQLLDGGDKTSQQPLYFFDKSYPPDDILTPVLQQLRKAAQNGKVGRPWFEEQFYALFARMLAVHRNIRHEINRLPAVRFATRVEIYRRLYRAKDFIDACCNQSLTLSQMSEQAFLSSYHFLRLFKEVFRETPYQYLTRQRLNRAKELVLKTDKSITQICYDVGFESLGSFSWLFRKHFKIPPSKLRS